MFLTAHQPAYLPWLGLFHKIAVCDAFYFLENVQFVPCDNISRNVVKTFQDKILLTVPVHLKGHMDSSISETRINNARNWRKKHWMTLLMNYGKAPYFKEHADFWEDLYKRDWDNLADLNFYMLQWHVETLGIQTRLLRDKEYGFSTRKSFLLAELCKKCGADHFLFGAMGECYADRELFARENIRIAFQHYQHPEYSQLNGPFLSHMACIDLIFNTGANALEILMSGNPGRMEIRYL